MNKESKGMLIGFIGILIFSLTLPVSKIAVLSFNPYFIAFGRATLAGLVALAYLAYKKERGFISNHEIKKPRLNGAF